MSRGKVKVAAARLAADKLEELGHPKLANDVRVLCRSNSSLIETCSRLWRENMELRAPK